MVKKFRNGDIYICGQLHSVHENRESVQSLAQKQMRKAPSDREMGCACRGLSGYKKLPLLACFPNSDPKPKPDTYTREWYMARYPETGRGHHPECEHYGVSVAEDPVIGLKGCIEHTTSGDASIECDLAYSMLLGPRGGRKTVPRQPGLEGYAKTAGRKSTDLHNTLCSLIERSGLPVLKSSFRDPETGQYRRGPGTAFFRLDEAVRATEFNRGPLSERMYTVPRGTRATPSVAEEGFQTFVRRLDGLGVDKGDVIGLLLAEYKSVERTRPIHDKDGSTLDYQIRLQGLPHLGIYLSGEVAQRIAPGLNGALGDAEARENPHHLVVLMAVRALGAQLCLYDAKHVAHVKMDEFWLPYENSGEQERFIQLATEQNRDFKVHAPYRLDGPLPIPIAVLLDCPETHVFLRAQLPNTDVGYHPDVHDNPALKSTGLKGAYYVFDSSREDPLPDRL